MLCIVNTHGCNEYQAWKCHREMESWSSFIPDSGDFLLDTKAFRRNHKSTRSLIFRSAGGCTWYGTGWCCPIPLADDLGSWQQKEGLAAWQGLLLKADVFLLQTQLSEDENPKRIANKEARHKCSYTWSNTVFNNTLSLVIFNLQQNLFLSGNPIISTLILIRIFRLCFTENNKP